MEQKYSLVEPTEKEKEEFMIAFNQFLTDSGMYYEPVPQFSRDSLTDPWKITIQVLLQKKVVNKDIPSPFQNELDKKN